MDPMESVNIDADSSFHLAMEAQARGHEIYYHTPDRLAFENGKVTAKGQKMRLRREHGNHVDLGPLEHLDLHAFDVVWLRQDPPFDMGYITTTPVLDLLKSDTLVVNDPFWANQEFTSITQRNARPRQRTFGRAHPRGYGARKRCSRRNK